MAAAPDLDHVALALAGPGPFRSMFAGDLAGRWVGGAETLGGFAFSQLRFANGMKLEGIVPSAAAGGGSGGANDFLVRFLAGAGPGPHHLTFKVADLEAALEQARAVGYRPMAVDLDGEHWKEAFLHPGEASGIVVQLAWSAGDLETAPPAELPAPRVDRPAELAHITHAVADLEAALRLFKGLLGGVTVDAGAGGRLGWVDLAWAGPGRVRLLAGDPVRSWVGERPGRLHHLAFRVEDPAGVAGSVAGDGWWQVPPAPPLGTRLVLAERDAPLPLGL